MRLQQLVVIFFSLVAPAAAQARCDPNTQYEDGGVCCTLCPPGTSMTSLGSCQEPQCHTCPDGDYQDKYTKDSKCLRQPYCDPNLNFQIPVYSPTKRSSCRCREGFHCSTQNCITCVAHTACKPGYGVTLRGNHSNDTVCEKCPEGTFSPNKSWTEACQKWTECVSGQKLVQSGTDTSDCVCAGETRTYVAAIIVGVIVGVLVLLGLGYLFIRRRRWSGGKVKGLLELCGEEEKNPPKENKPLVTNPEDAAHESTFSEHQISRDEPRTPVEVDDDLSQEISITTEIQFTDKGKYVMQDKGMKEMKSEDEA